MKLIKLLQQAYAIEIGAYQAYEGHWRSLKDEKEQWEIRSIQGEELWHKEEVGRMLSELKAKPNVILNAILWLIGKSISLACYVVGYKAAMCGAGLMEKLGALCYKRIAAEARAKGHRTMALELEDMQVAEEKHQKYFLGRLS